MKIDGLTLRIRMVDQIAPTNDHETALLKWLLSKFQREQNPVDIDESGANMQESPEEKDTP